MTLYIIQNQTNYMEWAEIWPEIKSSIGYINLYILHERFVIVNILLYKGLIFGLNRFHLPLDKFW